MTAPSRLGDKMSVPLPLQHNAGTYMVCIVRGVARESIREAIFVVLGNVRESGVKKRKEKETNEILDYMEKGMIDSQQPFLNRGF